VDHHIHHGMFGDINLIDAGASSNSEQLCQVFAMAGHTLIESRSHGPLCGAGDGHRKISAGKYPAPKPSGGRPFDGSGGECGGCVSSCVCDAIGPGPPFVVPGVGQSSMAAEGRSGGDSVDSGGFLETGAQGRYRRCGEPRAPSRERPRSLSFLREREKGGVKVSLRGERACGPLSFGRFVWGRGP
jgi:hypothetical protein